MFLASAGVAALSAIVGISLLRVYQGDPEPGTAQLDFDSVRIRTVPVQGDIYMLVGLGGNITVHVGDDGVLLVDSQYDQIAEKNLAAIRDLSVKPIRFILNTHGHVDHVSGNERLARPDATSAADAETEDARAIVMAHRNVLLRLSAPEGGRRAEIWPTDVYGFGERTLYFNGETIRLIHQPAAHTDGDSFIHFETTNVVSAGDIYNATRYPFIDQWSGGSFRGIVAGLARLVNIVVDDGVPGTLLIPGHGDLQAEDDVVAYYEMIVTIRDRIQEMILRGMSVEEIQAARPTREFDALYGHETGWWSTGDFVRAVTLELMADQGL